MSWQISGQYMETCSCTLLCPCIISNLAAVPTDGTCMAALAMRIDQGYKGDVQLDGVTFVLMLHAPGPMGEGNLKVGLIVDQNASDAQVDAIGAIASGAAGGPMAMLAPLVGQMAGIERRAVLFEQDGLHRGLHAGELVDQACDGLPSMLTPDEPMYIDNVGHPVNSKLALAKATRSRFHVFGIDWEDSSGTRNGHFAPFSWQG